MFAALSTLLYWSLLSSRQQLVEKFKETVEIVLDLSDPGYFNNVMDVIQKFINIVVKDSAPHSIKRLAKHSNGAPSCVRSKGELMTSYIERVLLPAQSYLNPASSDRASAGCQNLTIVQFSNANLTQETFASVRAHLVSATKCKSARSLNIY